MKFEEVNLVTAKKIRRAAWRPEFTLRPVPGFSHLLLGDGRFESTYLLTYDDRIADDWEAEY